MEVILNYSNYILLKYSVLRFFILKTSVTFDLNKMNMENLSLSNSCVNCDNLHEETKTCRVHQVAVSEKFTCESFEVNN